MEFDPNLMWRGVNAMLALLSAFFLAWRLLPQSQALSDETKLLGGSLLLFLLAAFVGSVDQMFHPTPLTIRTVFVSVAVAWCSIALIRFPKIVSRK